MPWRMPIRFRSFVWTKGFKGNDQLKTNAVQTFKSRAKEDEEAIVFRTV